VSYISYGIGVVIMRVSTILCHSCTWAFFHSTVSEIKQFFLSTSILLNHLISFLSGGGLIRKLRASSPLRTWPWRSIAQISEQHLRFKNIITIRTNKLGKISFLSKPRLKSWCWKGLKCLNRVAGINYARTCFDRIRNNSIENFFFPIREVIIRVFLTTEGTLWSRLRD